MNPFIFSGASNLTDEQILKLFIHDHNYSRFIQSKRNFFFWGERGSGKSMNFLYNKLVMQTNIAKSISESQAIEYLPVYVSCINPLVFKREYLLLNSEFHASIVSEHYFVLSMALSLVDELQEVFGNSNIIDDEELLLEIRYLFDIDIPSGDSALKSLKLFLRKEIIRTQKEINSPDSDSFYADTYTFASLIVPLIELFKTVELMKSMHFVFMIDDAHDLNSSQKSALNGWIAFRDNSSFSFKVSAAKVSEYELATASGGAILQGHDYVSINMEQAFQNSGSSYGKMAKKIIAKRLEVVGFDNDFDAGLFFPESKAFTEGIKAAEKKARELAVLKYGADETKKITDYVYKYARAIYFRERSPKANRVQYSGLDTIIHLSSGVIRNLLEPCYLMYDDMVSDVGFGNVEYITPSIQDRVIERLSDSYWERLRHGVDKEIPGCSELQAKQLSNLFHGLAEHFRDRMLDENCSEPRAIAFTISAKKDDLMSVLQPVLNLARSAQMIYVRTGTAKDKGAKEDYFVPNRMFWPARGLDPVGQHARVSFQAKVLVDVLETGKIPYAQKASIENYNDGQEDFFNE